MSKRSTQTELPRDAHVMQALRRELHRNSRQITQTFWQEFEQIRNRQRNQLIQERNHRERLSLMMRDANLETQQQAEALSRSISSHGVNPIAPSPRMCRDAPAIMPTAEEISKELKNSPVFKRPKSLANATNDSPLRQLPSTSSNMPRAPPSSRMTVIPDTPNMRMPARSGSTISKLQLASKPKK
ncbi:uncharacterized protein LOC6577441 [Drosophila mojavensis]|uniref:Uncharacterized protein n=1 Tax=Drosophila mojavensis TaxID=7230 RepID=B4KLG9_DROMO|nr:uncharacterized protein LOC6577441 [Drosophila mojavensis]EDW12850.1 uncharacterized protein Dmoj_GI22673 [Drosophila mojavensis]